MLLHNTSRLPPKVTRLTSSATILLVNEVVDAANYYRDRLGFAYNRFADEPPTFVLLHRDHCYLMLKQAVLKEHVVPNWHVSNQLWNVYFWVTDATSLFHEYQRRGAKFEYELIDQPYGVREFAVQDIDGYSLGFGQELSRAPVEEE
jgi:uncharacterized glyoxalase superfamily protein PhnB